jgi:type II secretion system protein I
MNSDERGFTLIELLVSLAILSIALAVLLNSISSALDRTRQSRSDALASSLAQSLLARAQNEPLPTRRDADGVYSNDFRWQLLFRPYGDGSDIKAWHSSAYIVKATVSWRDGSQPHARTLTGLRIVPPPLSP